MKSAASPNVKKKTKKETSLFDRLVLIFFGVLALFFAEAFLYWTVVPFLQMRTYLNDLAYGRIQKIAKTEFIFSPYSYAQRVIRYEFLKYIVEQNIDVRSISILDKAIKEMEELVEKEGSDPYQHIRLAQGYEKKVALIRDPSYFQQAEKYYKSALVIAPQRQEMYYQYALFLIRQGRSNEAVQILKEPPVLDQDIPPSYYYLGLAQFNLGEESYGNALTNMEIFFEQSRGNLNPNISQAIYQALFHYFYKQRDVTRLLIAANRLSHIDTERQKHYQQVIAFLKQNDQFPRLDFKEGLLQTLLSR